MIDDCVLDRDKNKKRQKINRIIEMIEQQEARFTGACTNGIRANEMHDEQVNRVHNYTI